jgi:hypothetical protein
MNRNNLPLQELSINDVFKSEENIIYEIPIYQRNYAWEKEEIEALVRDVWDACEMNKSTYFIGTLVTFYKGTHTYEVIDGQQRLTTLYLILKALEIEISNKLTYRARKRSNQTIELIPDFNHNNIDSGIKKGYEDASLAIKEIVSSNNKKKFTYYLLNCVHIIHYNVHKDVDLNHYFEVMNSRGEQLEKHEIVKAKLVALLDDKERAKFSNIWNSCSEMATYVQLKYPQAENIFGNKLNDFLYYGQSFDELPNFSETDIKKFKLIDFINAESETNHDKEEDERGRNKMFQPIIDFSNFLLIVLKITRMEETDFQPTEFILDDKELINAFDKAKPDRNFAKRFCFNLLQAKYLLDNYIVHHSNEEDTTDYNPWQLQHWQKEEKSGYPKNLSDNKDLQDKMTQLLSMFEVSFTPRQRKNYLFYCLYHLFKNRDLQKYSNFLKGLANKYFFDIYLNKELLNEINTPLPRAFDQVIIDGKNINLTHCNENSDFNSIYGDGSNKTKGIPLFVFNYFDFLIWEKYADKLSGEKLKEGSDERNIFFQNLGCSDFGLKVFNQFYFSRTRRSLEHYYPQANIDASIDENHINCFGNFAMIGNDANSSGSNWSPKTKLDHYLDSSGKIIQVSVASLKFRIMMQICKDNLESKTRANGQEWIFDDIKTHQEIMLSLLPKTNNI